MADKNNSKILKKINFKLFKKKNILKLNNKHLRCLPPNDSAITYSSRQYTFEFRILSSILIYF